MNLDDLMRHILPLLTEALFDQTEDGEVLISTGLWVGEDENLGFRSGRFDSPGGRE